MEGIENHLKNLSNAYAHFTLFETTAEFSLISSSIESILRSSSSLEGFNETLKLILSTLIDSIWASLSINEQVTEEICVSSQMSKKSENFKEKIEVKTVPKHESGFQPLRYQDLLSSVKSEELLTSDGHTKPNNAPHGKMFFKHRRENSHNSDPYNNIDYVLKSSPKISFPKQARKFTFNNSTSHSSNKAN